MAKRRVVVLLDDNEYIQVCIRAGLIPLSSWFRSLALAEAGFEEKHKTSRLRSGLPEVSGVAANVVGERKTPGYGNAVPSAIATRSCSHKKQRGELCYKCDPKFGKPEIKEEV